MYWHLDVMKLGFVALTLEHTGSRSVGRFPLIVDCNRSLASSVTMVQVPSRNTCRSLINMMPFRGPSNEHWSTPLRNLIRIDSPSSTHTWKLLRDGKVSTQWNRFFYETNDLKFVIRNLQNSKYPDVRCPSTILHSTSGEPSLVLSVGL